MKKLNIKELFKESFKKSFKSKRFRYGGYSALLTIVVIGIVISANLIVNKLDLKYDMTKDKLFSLSDQSYKILGNLKNNVKIIGFYEAGKENESIKEVLSKYKKASKKVSVEFKDPVMYPEVAKKYSKDGKDLTAGTLVVQSGNKYKTIDPDSLVNINYSTNQVESYAVEQSITGAIMYVTSDKNYSIYNLKGHNEETLSTTISSAIENENYTINDVDLLTQNLDISKSNMVMIINPQRDLSNDEYQKISKFFKSGGRGIFIMGLLRNNLPNFNKLFSDYGLGLEKSIIVEGDSKYSLQNPIYLVPEMQSHEIVDPLISSQLSVITPVAFPIKQLSVKNKSIEIEPLLLTTKNSWGKKNLDATTAQKENGDEGGPFNVAVAVTDSSTNAKLIIVSSGAFVDSSLVSSNRIGNVDFFMNSINWTQGNKENISIRPKSASSTYLNMNGFGQLMCSGLVIIIIPLIILVLGIAVWIRRKNL